MHSSTYTRGGDLYEPERKNRPTVDRYGRLIPAANNILFYTSKIAWKLMKGLASVAFRIPRIFTRLNSPESKGRPGGSRTRRNSISR